MTNSILVVAAHADDEVLGCGGAIARHVAEGCNVNLAIVADGVSSRDGSADLNSRMKAAEKSSKILGIDSISWLGFPDNKMDSVPLLEVTKKIEKIVNKFSPTILYTHHQGDLNVDHRITNQAVLTACRPMPGHCVKEIRAFEVLSSTEWAFGSQPSFAPNIFVDISSYLHKKLAAIDAYNLEMRKPPHSRSTQHVEVLARHRGYSAGLTAAEAFSLVRMVW